MTTTLVLLFASAAVGLTTGFFFRVWSLLLVSPVIAVLAAIVLQTSGFGFWSGIPVVIGSLMACQFAYMAGAFHVHKGELLAQDDGNAAPGHDGQQGIGDENE